MLDGTRKTERRDYEIIDLGRILITVAIAFIVARRNPEASGKSVSWDYLSKTFRTIWWDYLDLIAEGCSKRETP
ncbi:hypothetical protein NC652_004844 [Populus alba x Populus x berolinensis]|nr:hypothetical protein NC652_004844 [Populus alba x Populus x berolinensis]